MTTNPTARTWCYGDYDYNKESYYVSSVKKLILREWTASVKHAIISVVFVVLMSAFGFISNPVLWLSAMQVGFMMYGFLSFSHNDTGAGGLAYIACLIFFIKSLNNGGVLMVLFCIVGICLLIASVYPLYLYKKASDAYKETTQRQWANDEEEFEAWKRKYYNQSSYSSSDSSSTNSNIPGSTPRPVGPHAQMAKDAFDGHYKNYEELKKRYRALSKIHHPDRGGDEEKFKAILAEYEYLKDTKFAGQK